MSAGTPGFEFPSVGGDRLVGLFKRRLVNASCWWHLGVQVYLPWPTMQTPSCLDVSIQQKSSTREPTAWCSVDA